MNIEQNPNMLITGSSRGIGEAVARLARLRGFEVILHGKTKSDYLENLAEDLNAKFVCFDLANPREIQESLRSLDSLNVLVNNAAVNISGKFDALDYEDWQRVFEINVLGTVNVVKSALPALNQGSGGKRIVNIGSVKGLNTSVGRCAYASSKSAISNLTAGMAKEFAPNILVNCVAPGFVETAMTAATMSERISKQIESALLGRLAHPSEIAEAVLFLSEEKSSFITGQTLLVDGGFSIGKD